MDELLTIKDILVEERRINRKISPLYWCRQFERGKIAGAHKVKLNRVWTWHCTRSAYQQFVEQNLTRRDIAEVAQELGNAGELQSGWGGWYTARDAVQVLNAAGYKITLRGLHLYLKRGIIPFRPAQTNGRYMIALEHLCKFPEYQLPVGRPYEKVQNG